MTEKEEMQEAFEEALENSEVKAQTRKQKRSFINPIYWMGICTQICGLLLCVTIIGIPFGIGVYSAGQDMKYK